MHFSTVAIAIISFSATALAQSINCHGSGQWAKQADGRTAATAACNAMANQSGGSRTSCQNGPNNIRWNFSVTGAFAGTSVCVSNMNNIIANCHGDNADTRGGYISASTGYPGYSADPNAGAC